MLDVGFHPPSDYRPSGHNPHKITLGQERRNKRPADETSASGHQCDRAGVHAAEVRASQIFEFAATISRYKVIIRSATMDQVNCSATNFFPALASRLHNSGS